MSKTLDIDYKKLRKISPEAARTAVLNYLYSSNRSVSKTAKAFGVQRAVVYDIIKRSKANPPLGGLQDRSKAPKVVRNRTSEQITRQILKAKDATGFGPKRLFTYLQIRYGLYVAYGTIRSVIERSKKQSMIL